MFKFKSVFLLTGIILAHLFMTTSCSKQVKETAGIRTENLDTTFVPGDDFYAFATAGWQELHPITAEYARFGSFDKLAEDNREQLKGLIQEIASKKHSNGSIAQKIGDLYNQAMDSVKRNDDGIAPVLTDLNKINAMTSVDEMSSVIPQLMKEGIFPYFLLYVGADRMSSNDNLVQTYQGGIAMGQRDYYLDTDEAISNIRAKYSEFVAAMFEKTGMDSQEAATVRDHVLHIETRLATKAYDNITLRNPHQNYNKMNLEELSELVPQIDWEIFFNSFGVQPEFISVSQREHMVEVANILANEPLDVQKSYLKWNVIQAASDYLSDEINDLNFGFYGTVLSGKEEQQPRWKRAVSVVDGSLGEAVGEMYVKKYFPAEAKARMLHLVENLQIALGERIQNLDWMSDETKEKAMDKLGTFHVKIGYPDKWRDYTSLEIKNDNLWENMKRVNTFRSEYMFSKVGKPVDKDEWMMTPQTVNAYYNPTTNEICFPAGILQYPFFDMNADDAFNYGAIGVVIGHEMTHGFDDSGRQYDKDGNLKDWWTQDDSRLFDERADRLVDFYDKIEVAPGVFGNGRFTLGENIADQGGIQVSYQAFEKVLEEQNILDKEGFTPQQRFFIAYANVWAGNIRHEEILKRTKTDPHSLGKWRVNGALPHIDAWYTAFNINSDHEMYIAPEERAVVW